MNSTEKISDGGPAFPPSGAAYEFVGVQIGMSLRDWFAGQALAAIIGKTPFHETPIEQGSQVRDYAEAIAIGAYIYADAMLAERVKAGAS